MVLLCGLIIFFFKNVYSLVEHFNRIFKSMSIGKPILLLELFHIAEIKFGYWGRPIFRFWMLVLYPLSDSINRRVHQLIEVYGVLWIQHLVIVDPHGLFEFLAFFDGPSSTPQGILKPPLKLLHLFLLRSQLIVQLNILRFLLCELLLYHDDLFLHEPSLLIAHALLLQLLDLFGEWHDLLRGERLNLFLLGHETRNLHF